MLQFTRRLFGQEVQTCSVCGRCRADSQVDCDCGARRKRRPVFTGISLLLNAVVELDILWTASELHSADLAAGALLAFTVLCVIASTIVSVVLGVFSHRRGEGWGWLVSAAGIATWFATIAYILRH
jgi:hypothetical protein